MKFTQEQKETIFNNYINFVNTLAADLDFKTEVGPEEIVYAVLGLVEDSINIKEKALSNFKREKRYTVIKHNQLTDAQMQYLKDCIFGEGIPTVECVVIESDWPEYDPVWGMLEDRFQRESSQS